MRDDNEMPYDNFGNRADVIMDPSSVPSRMNAGRLYEQYFNAISRHTKKQVINMLGNVQDVSVCNDSQINQAFDVVLGLLKIIGTEQYDGYKQIKDRETKEVVLQEIIDKELFLLYKISSAKKPYQISLEVQGTMYEPPIDHINIKSNGMFKPSIDKIMIAPLYVILLAKTADNFLSTASAKTNHYGLPIGVGNTGKHRLPWRNSPVKILSETETRLFLAYGSRLGVAELKDRGNAMETHEHVYRNILNARTPTNIDRVVDRNKIPYGGDAALALVNDIFNAGGISIEYVPDNNVIHPKISK